MVLTQISDKWTLWNTLSNKQLYLFSIFFLLSTFRILFRGIRDGSLSLFLLRFMVSFKNSPFSKLIEISRLYSEHAVQILTSIAVQFLDPVIKDSEGFCVPLRTLKIVTFWYTASFTLLVTRTAELVIQFNWLNGQRAPWLSSFLLRPQRNGHQAALLRPQRVGLHNGHQATLLGLFVLRPQRIRWHKIETTCKKETKKDITKFRNLTCDLEKEIARVIVSCNEVALSFWDSQGFRGWISLNSDSEISLFMPCRIWNVN